MEPVSTHKYENMTLNNILAISKDSSNNYLFGTSYGLIKYTSETSYQLFNAKNGFLNNTVHAILKNSPDNFWLSTNLGLINFDTKRNVFRSYGFSDGLKVVEFSDGAAFRDPDTGTLFFGGINGFVAIRADGRPEQLYMPPVYFDKLSIFGKQYNLGEFLTRKEETEVLNLQYDQNFFSVSFASVDYLNGNNCTYFYKLKGLSDQWVNNGSESAVSFTNMAPGEYTLLVKYYNSVFDKESDVYSLVIRIGDPWYASWWAYLIYALCLLLLAGLLIRSFILRSKRKKQELLNEIEKRHQKNVFESKLRFFTNIAHEFCTPLTLIYGPCGRILSSKGLSKFVADYVQMIQTNAERLNNLIHELIEFRRIETGNREVRVESLNVSSIMKGIAKTFVEMAKSRNITFLSKIPEQVMWNSDKGFLNTIIINLISNAFKYTPNGKMITVFIREDEGTVSVGVQDQGIGIAENKRKSLFVRFENLVDKNIFNQASSGIGLSLVKELVEMHKATISVDSRLGEGSCFKVDFLKGKEHYSSSVEFILEDSAAPLSMERIVDIANSSLQTEAAIVDAPDLEVSAAKEEAGESSSKELMLLVEDNQELRSFLRSIFASTYRVVEASDGMEGWSKALKYLPDIIISDVMMPEKDGIEMTRELRADMTTSHIPIILLTAKTTIESKLEGLEYGADDYITKPFSATYLQARVENLLMQRKKLQNFYRDSLTHVTVSETPVAQGETLAGHASAEPVSSAAEEPAMPEMSPNDRKFMDKLVDLMEKNMDNGELVVDDLVRELAVSRSVFFKKLKTLTGLAPVEFIKEMRIKRAAQLIETGEFNMTQISYMVGINDPRYFSKCFKEYFGVAPSVYQRGVDGDAVSEEELPEEKTGEQEENRPEN